jgi:carboxylesterase type B
MCGIITIHIILICRIDFLYGNPANWPFNAWVSQSPNIIVVSVYYRLDSFGFLSHPDMPVSDLNAGTQDQIQALRWVQDHIGKFGGDKNKVTISGQSAGGASVEFLLTLDDKLGDGLYNAAIAQSISRRPLPLPAQQVVSKGRRHGCTFISLR